MSVRLSGDVAGQFQGDIEVPRIVLGVFHLALFFPGVPLRRVQKVAAAEDIIFPIEAGVKDIEIVVRAQPDSKGVVMLGDTVFVSPVRLKPAGT